MNEETMLEIKAFIVSKGFKDYIVVTHETDSHQLYTMVTKTESPIIGYLSVLIEDRLERIEEKLK